MNEIPTGLAEFLEYASKLKGDEKGEAHLFCDRFFKAFGHGGIKEADGTLEARIKFSTTGRTKFADCIWSPRGREGVLIEMKKRAERNLEKHFPQVRDYWIEMNPEIVIGPGAQKPAYIILCNFDRFIIYRQLSKVDDLRLDEIVDRAGAFNFMLPEEREPIFRHNVEDISRETANTLGELFKHLVHEREVSPEDAQRFVLQSVLALFSEDFGLLPQDFFTEIIRDCQLGSSAYDLIGGLFQQMASLTRAKGGRFKDVQYFNGGLFDTVEPLEIDACSLDLLAKAAEKNWKAVNPAIFGSLFEGTLSKEERHAFGAHFTAEVDMLKIINPTIVRPWKQRIATARTLTELRDLYQQLGTFTVLDPACGCGNFLYVAYQALKELEQQLVRKIVENYSRKSVETVLSGGSRITTQQFKGIDIQPIAVEVAKMTMMIAKEIAVERWNSFLVDFSEIINLDLDTGLPLDRLDDHIVCGDALFDDWPAFDAIIGNPPFLSKNKMQQEMDPTYIAAVRAKYPEVPGRADYCVYWLRRAHDELALGQRAGLVGTNTIRQNYSRMGGLDYIVREGGTITEAVSSQVWSGDAVVHVSIVNWIKGKEPGKKRLTFQTGDNIKDSFEFYELDKINSALSPGLDVTEAASLLTNEKSGTCYQGQTHGDKGFLISQKEALEMLADNPEYSENLFPYLIGNELLGAKNSLPKRYVIDLNNADDVFTALEQRDIYDILRAKVEPVMRENAEAEREKYKFKKGPRQNHYRKWWKFWRARGEMIEAISQLPRYIVCVRVTKRPIFEFIHPDIHPNDALIIFPLADDYSFGILQSELHWEWFCARCSTLKRDYRYTSNTVFDSFPWPQDPKLKNVQAVAQAAVALRKIRRQTMKKHNWSLRELYKTMEDSLKNPVSKAQSQLDRAVKTAYKMPKRAEILRFLLDLNKECWDKEQANIQIQEPGLPDRFKDKTEMFSTDCVSMS